MRFVTRGFALWSHRSGFRCEYRRGQYRKAPTPRGDTHRHPHEWSNAVPLTDEDRAEIRAIVAEETDRAAAVDRAEDAAESAELAADIAEAIAEDTGEDTDPQAAEDADDAAEDADEAASDALDAAADAEQATTADEAEQAADRAEDAAEEAWEDATDAAEALAEDAEAEAGDPDPEVSEAIDADGAGEVEADPDVAPKREHPWFRPIGGNR